MLRSFVHSVRVPIAPKPAHFEELRIPYPILLSCASAREQAPSREKATVAAREQQQQKKLQPRNIYSPSRKRYADELFTGPGRRTAKVDDIFMSHVLQEACRFYLFPRPDRPEHTQTHVCPHMAGVRGPRLTEPPLAVRFLR